MHGARGKCSSHCSEHFPSLVVRVVITRKLAENRAHVFRAPMRAAFRAFSNRPGADFASTGRIRFHLIYVARHLGPAATKISANGGHSGKQSWVKGGRHTAPALTASCTAVTARIRMPFVATGLSSSTIF